MHPLPPKRRRSTHMPVQDQRLLDDWGRNLRQMFNGEVPYHVGSSLYRPDYRDVDVRVILDDDTHSDLSSIVSIPRLNVCLSLWGERVTGLLIDCQVQQRTAANEQYSQKANHRRNPLGISDWSTNRTLALG